MGWRLTVRRLVRRTLSNESRQHSRDEFALTGAITPSAITVVSIRFRVLYGFVILSLERRVIVHVGVTEHPTAAWAAQRVVEVIAAT